MSSGQSMIMQKSRETESCRRHTLYVIVSKGNCSLTRPFCSRTLTMGFTDPMILPFEAGFKATNGVLRFALLPVSLFAI